MKPYPVAAFLLIFIVHQAMATLTPTLGANPLVGGNNAKKNAAPALGSTGLSLPPLKTPAATTATPTLSGAAPVTINPAGGLTLGAKIAATSAPATTSGASTLASTLSGPKPASNQLTFSQLEDSINKWTAELAEEERTFLNQAAQINSWDKAINENEHRLVSLNSSVKQVQDQQTRINYDLDFILTQLRDLEQCIAPLEKEGDSYLTMKCEPQRKQLYMTATQIDSQMKRLSEDLKEVIEQINEASRAIDSSDPVLQVGRVLNAHMDSLQTIDENATRIHENLESLSKVHSRLKKDAE